MNQQMFMSIRENFVNLLKDGNNSYKYVRQYREKINKYIEEDIEPILNQLLYILLTIYTEKTKCRFHTNDDKAEKIENIIIMNAVKILNEEKYKNQKIVEINEIVTKTNKIDDKYFSIYKNKYGLQADIKNDKIAEITDRNVKDIYTNFNNIKKLLEPIEHLNHNLKEIDDYLFCLYYFV